MHKNRTNVPKYLYTEHSSDIIIKNKCFEKKGIGVAA
jgi:hypothetical protein